MATIAILFLAVGLCNYEYETNSFFSFETLSSFIDIPQFLRGCLHYSGIHIKDGKLVCKNLPKNKFIRTDKFRRIRLKRIKVILLDFLTSNYSSYRP